MHELDTKGGSVKPIRADRNRDKSKKEGISARGKDRKKHDVRRPYWHCANVHHADKNWYWNHTCRTFNNKERLQVLCKKGSMTQAVKYDDNMDDESVYFRCPAIFCSRKISTGYTVDITVEGDAVSMVINMGQQ